MRLFAPLLMVLPILAGCAGGPNWVNPALPRDRLSGDLSECRAEAEEMLGPSAYTDPGNERTGNPMTLVDQTQNAKRFEYLVAACMAEKGYRRAK
jgi:hypothetical protein